MHACWPQPLPSVVGPLAAQLQQQQQPKHKRLQQQRQQRQDHQTLQLTPLQQQQQQQGLPRPRELEPQVEAWAQVQELELALELALAASGNQQPPLDYSVRQQACGFTLCVVIADQQTAKTHRACVVLDCVRIGNHTVWCYTLYVYAAVANAAPACCQVSQPKHSQQSAVIAA